jgi:hypothetical protein
MFQQIQLPFVFVDMEHVSIYLFPYYTVIRLFFVSMFCDVLNKVCE